MTERDPDSVTPADAAPSAAPSQAERNLAATPATAGAMLRQLRESAGVHAAVLASALKVPLQKVEALEADRIDLLPDVTFARGLASAICRAFGADPAPVLERMPVSASGLGTSVPTVNQPFRRISDRPTPVLATSFSKPLLIAVGLLLLGAVLLWLLPTLPIQLNAPPAPPPVAEVPARDTPMVSTPTLEPAASGEIRSAELPPGASTAEQGVAPAAATASAASAASAARSAASGAVSANAAAQLLQFVASGETWVTVRDNAGKQLINRALAGGETVAVNEGELPLSVTVGRKDVVKISVRGEPFDLAALGKSNVARFQVK